jgi:RNA polymerase sigma-70 factor (ECF subfamily)
MRLHNSQKNALFPPVSGVSLMGNSDDATSLTLLRVLCQPEKDDEAWRVFCERYRPLIQRWCTRFRLQAADVDDVSQKVLQRVFSRISSYDPERGHRFRGWLKTIVENAVKDLLRSGARRPGDRGSGDNDTLLQNIAEPGSIDALVNELDTSLQRDLADIVARVEKEMTPETMSCFRQVMLEGQAIADVAADLGKSYAAVCMAVQRVKKKLRAEGAKQA